MGGFGTFFQNTDAFRSVPKEFRRSSALGGCLTLLTFLFIALVVLSEVSTFLTWNYSFVVNLDTNMESDLQVNFDITMYDLPCQYVRIANYDSFGEERVDVENLDAFVFKPIDKEGSEKGRAYTTQELELLERDQQPEEFVGAANQAELDADWASTDDHFKHASFKDVATFHEFTLILFYADWCSHCRDFHPHWDELVKTVSMNKKVRFNDENKQPKMVKFMKVNCVDFEKTCDDAKIRAYPSLMLYSDRFALPERSIPPVPFVGQRNKENIKKFLKDVIAKTHKEHAHYHAMFAQGCNIRGHLDVPRVPGEFHLTVNSDHMKTELNTKMVNVSHTINHLSFGGEYGVLRDLDMFESQYEWKVPRDILKHMAPLDGKGFVTKHFHEAPQHYLKIVTTKVGTLTTYQFTHTNHVSSVDKHSRLYDAPVAKFIYDLNPLSIRVKPRAKKWYEFVTSLLALMGGCYTCAKLTSRAVITAVGKKDN